MDCQVLMGFWFWCTLSVFKWVSTEDVESLRIFLRTYSSLNSSCLVGFLVFILVIHSCYPTNLTKLLDLLSQKRFTTSGSVTAWRICRLHIELRPKMLSELCFFQVVLLKIMNKKMSFIHLVYLINCVLLDWCLCFVRQTVSRSVSLSSHRGFALMWICSDTLYTLWGLWDCACLQQKKIILFCSCRLCAFFFFTCRLQRRRRCLRFRVAVLFYNKWVAL